MRKRHQLPNAAKDIHQRLAKDKKLAARAQVEHAKLILAHKLAELREKLHMTQTQLAHRIGVSPQIISRIEKGEQNITIETLMKWLYALQVVARLNFDPSESAGEELLKIA